MPDPDEHDHQDDEQQQQQQDEQQDDTGARLDRLETTVGRIAAAVDRLLPGSRQDRLDRPADIQAQVRAELERRDREAAEQQAAQTAEQEQRELRETVARLQEQPPAPPVPRRTRLLGWGE